MSDRKYSFSQLARHLNVPVEDIKNCVMVERICIPERVASNGDKVDFEFGNLPIGDVVTNEGVILAKIDRDGNPSRPNWTTIEAGQFFVNETDIEKVRLRLCPPSNSRSASSRSLAVSQEGDDWRDLARLEAKRFVTDQAKRDMHPNQMEIADEVAKRFRTQGIVGADGKPLSGTYIKRHALKGITSARQKAKSVQNDWSK